jgi:hypothetical protein
LGSDSHFASRQGITSAKNRTEGGDYMSTTILKKTLVALSVVTLTAVAGVASSHAISASSQSSNKDYSKDQCKNGGWKNFKAPDGSMLFKSQGQCIAFFNHKKEGDDNSVNVDNNVNVDARTGNVSIGQSSGSATIRTGDSSPTIDISNTINANH